MKEQLKKFHLGLSLSIVPILHGIQIFVFYNFMFNGGGLSSNFAVINVQSFLKGGYVVYGMLLIGIYFIIRRLSKPFELPYGALINSLLLAALINVLVFLSPVSFELLKPVLKTMHPFIYSVLMIVLGLCLFVLKADTLARRSEGNDQ